MHLYKAYSYITCRKLYSHLTNIKLYYYLFNLTNICWTPLRRSVWNNVYLALEGSKNSPSKLLLYNGGNMHVLRRNYVKESLAKRAHRVRGEFCQGSGKPRLTVSREFWQTGMQLRVFEAKGRVWSRCRDIKQMDIQGEVWPLTGCICLGTGLGRQSGKLCGSMTKIWSALSNREKLEGL